MATMEDCRSFLKGENVFAVEWELQVLFERFDRNGDGIVMMADFLAGITPFMNVNNS